MKIMEIPGFDVEKVLEYLACYEPVQLVRFRYLKNLRVNNMYSVYNESIHIIGQIIRIKFLTEDIIKFFKKNGIRYPTDMIDILELFIWSKLNLKEFDFTTIRYF